MKQIKKQLIFRIISIILIIVFFCGCFQEGKATGDTDKVQLTRFWKTKRDFYDNYDGKIKNIAGYNLDSIKVTLKFYDKNNNLLFEKIDYVDNLTVEQEKFFTVSVYHNEDNYENIDYIIRDLKVQ